MYSYSYSVQKIIIATLWLVVALVQMSSSFLTILLIVVFLPLYSLCLPLLLYFGSHTGGGVGGISSSPQVLRREYFHRFLVEVEVPEESSTTSWKWCVPPLKRRDHPLQDVFDTYDELPIGCRKIVLKNYLNTSLAAPGDSCSLPAMPKWLQNAEWLPGAPKLIDGERDLPLCMSSIYQEYLLWLQAFLCQANPRHILGIYTRHMLGIYQAYISLPHQNMCWTSGSTCPTPVCSKQLSVNGGKWCKNSGH